MSRPIRSLIAMLTFVALAACGGEAPTPTPDTTMSPAPTVPGTPDGSPTAGPTESPDSPEPTGNGDASFTCDLPIVEPGSATIANIVDVRVGTHDGYDRFVIEFEQGTPEFTLERAEPPFVEDGSGFPVEVSGDRFLGLVMRGGTKQTDAGTSSYDGPTEFATGFPMLVAAVETGDFERQGTWVLGLADDACVRVLLLDEPPRLVIDVER
jgi:predicted small lipoprotein YifL